MKLPKYLNRRIAVAALCSVAAFNFSACKKGADPGTPEEAAEKAAEAVANEPAIEIDSSGYNSKRTQAFGILSRMPVTTEGAFGLRNLSSLVNSFLDSNTYKRAVALAEQQGGMSVDMQQAETVKVMVDQYVGKEVFVIMAEGSSKQIERLQVISQLLNDSNMQAAGATLAGTGGGDPAAMMASIRTGLRDENSEISKSLEAFQMVPLLMGSKVTDGAEQVIAQLDALEANLPPIFTVSKIDAGGGKFTSWKVNLQDVINEGAVAQINELLQDQAASERVADVLRKKTVEFTYGIVDNYLLFTLGADHKHLNFVTKPEESILAASTFGFSDQFLGKKLLGYSFMSNTLLKGGTKGGQLNRMADAFSKGLATGGPAMKKLAGQVRKLAGHAENLAKRGSQTYLGMAYMEDGIRSESIGGYTTDMVDFKAESEFANSAPADAAMVFSSVANKKHRGESIAMLETMFSTVETGIAAFAESSGDGSSLEQYEQMEQMFGGNLTNIWGILKGKFVEGLGAQSGVIVDLNGEMPKNLPNVPNVLQQKGKIPRIALAANVEDRAKLAEAWKELVPELNAAMKNIPGQQPGAEAQVPDVLSDDGDQLSSHYFPIPFMTKDFLPSVSLSDELFFMSTSKEFSQKLATGRAGNAKIRGVYMKVNFSQIHQLAENWVTLLLENGEAVFGGPEGAESFQRQAGQIQGSLEFTRGVKGFWFNRYQEESGAMRGSWHLHIKDIGPAVD